MTMRVDFYKAKDGQLCGWVATLPKRRPFQGTTMAAGRSAPHDLMQFVVERALGIRDGFWGLLAHGAWFKGVPGLRPTRWGRDLARAHQAAAAAALCKPARLALRYSRSNRLFTSFGALRTQSSRQFVRRLSLIVGGIAFPNEALSQ